MRIIEQISFLLFIKRLDDIYTTRQKSHQQSIGLFIRKLVGLDRRAAIEAFGEFLSGSTCNATQIRFVEQIISYLTRNGIMEPGLLYNPPFTDTQ